MLRWVMVVLLCAVTACAQLPDKSSSLYQQLGEDKGIDAIVYELLVNIANDERVVERFRDVNIERFRAGLANYICSVSGGPCEYRGDSMQVVHAGHNYTSTEFNAVVDNLIKAMETQGVAVTTQNRLLALLAPSYSDVVYQ